MSQQENIMDMKPNYEAIPLTERLEFQRTLILAMPPPDFRQKPRQEQILLEIDWAEKYAKKISKTIDDTKNIEIRELILDKRYEEACVIMLKTLVNE